MVILILFGVLIFKNSDSVRESVGDVKQKTLEYERQGKTQTELLERQRVAAAQETVRQASEAKRRAAIARIEGLESQLAVLRQSLAATEAEKAVYTTKIKDYMMDHKLAIAAMGITIAGTGVAVDKSNNFDDNQKTVATVGAIGAGLYALYNHKECMEVADRMAKAATMQTDLDNRIQKTKKQFDDLQTQITQERKQM